MSTVSTTTTVPATTVATTAATTAPVAKPFDKNDALAILNGQTNKVAEYAAKVGGFVFALKYVGSMLAALVGQAGKFDITKAYQADRLPKQIQVAAEKLAKFVQNNPTLQLKGAVQTNGNKAGQSALSDQYKQDVKSLTSKVVTLANIRGFTDASQVAAFVAAVEDLYKGSADAVNAQAGKVVVPANVKNSTADRYIPNRALQASNEAFAKDVVIPAAIAHDDKLFDLPVVINKHLTKMQQAFQTVGDAAVVTFKSLLRFPDLKGLQTRLADPKRTELTAAVEAFKKACDGQIATLIKKAQELRGVCGADGQLKKSWIAHVDAMKNLLILVTDAQRAINKQPKLTDAEKKAITDLNPEAASTHADLTARLTAVDGITSTLTALIPVIGNVAVKDIVDAVETRRTTLKAHEDFVAEYNKLVGTGSNPDVKAADGSYIVAAGSEVAKLQEQKANATPVIEKKFADLLGYVNVVVAAVDGAKAAHKAAKGNVETRNTPNLAAFVTAFNTNTAPFIPAPVATTAATTAATTP